MNAPGKKIMEEIIDPQYKEVLAWAKRHKEKTSFQIERIPFRDSKEWSFTVGKEALEHKSGRFFAIRGYRSRPNYKSEFCQPLIHQWEIGIQGFIVRNYHDEMQLLAQAKIEPGNIGVVQVSPTLQVTRSNLQAVHQGRKPAFSDIFLDLQNNKVLINQLQSELGTRYFQKWNENLVIESPEELPFDPDRFKWISVNTFKYLLQKNNLVNNDARLVLGLLLLELGERYTRKSPVQEMLMHSRQNKKGVDFETQEAFSNWLYTTRKKYTMTVDTISLPEMKGWLIDDDEIRPASGKDFSIIQLQVHSSDREVTDWDQPIVTSHRRGTIGLIGQLKEGVMHFLFQATPEIGNQAGAELSPSLNLEGGEIPEEQQNLLDYLDNAKEEEVILQCLASEEGGRFFQDESVYKIVFAGENEKLEIPDYYCWLTLGQISELMGHRNIFSDAARGILALLLSKT